LKPEIEPNIFELERLEKELSEVKAPVNLSDTLSVYLKDIGVVELLTRDEEIELAKTISRAHESADGEVIRLGKEARDRLIVANLRLVVSIAKKYTFSNVPLMDLIQEGAMGLMKAVDRYQVEKGFKFSTYATWWIRQSISRSISNDSRTIRLPAYIYDALSKVRKVKSNYLNEHGIEPDIETISQKSGISIVTLKMINLCSEDAVSLDQIVGDGDTTIKDLAQDTSNLNPDEYNKAKEMDEFVSALLQELDERERTIIKMRFGIESNEKTLEEIGQFLGITRERVRQLESRAIEKLKKKMSVSNRD
jgi:RNA polymerase primary sigma factor